MQVKPKKLTRLQVKRALAFYAVLSGKETPLELQSVSGTRQPAKGRKAK